MYPRLSLLLVLIMLLTACGQKGPLYFPDSSPDNRKSTR
jgi:predicted small lipoprotein YifL